MSASSGAARPIEPLGEPLDAVVRVPGSKSITNRALVCAALAEGTSRLEGVLFADDTEAMLDVLDRLGVALDIDRDHHVVTIEGTAGRLPAGPVALDARLSGTTSRFAAPMLALGAGPYRLDGAEPLRARPMADGFDALEALGATIVPQGEPGHLPVDISRGPVEPATTEVGLRADVSSQFVSGLLLSAPARPGGLRIHLEGDVVSRPYLDMTIAVMAAFGVTVEHPDPHTFVVPGTGYRAATYPIEPDASAASYFFAAPLIACGQVLVEGLAWHALQGDVRFVEILERMGAEVEWGEDFIEVRRPTGPDGKQGNLHGIKVNMADCSDTAQTLAVVAVFADGPTTVTGIGFIRRKETDRVAAVVTELRRCGIEAHEIDDGFVIHPGKPQPAVIQTYDDHRMAMSFALLGLAAPGIEIADPGCVAKTFPTFWDVLGSLSSGGNAE